MPRKNSLKTYIEGGYYHIYNRGVEKRMIFMDNQDYKLFISYLAYALSDPPDPSEYEVDLTFKGEPFKGVPRLPLNFQGKIQLLAYCLLPNHFHLQIQQVDSDSLKSFSTSVMTRYSMYFNKRYNRVGSLFQGPYKAVIIRDDYYLLHLSRYIHLNPKKNYKDLTRAYSSYADYLHLRNSEWVKTDTILNYFENKVAPEFKKFNSYKKFVEGYKTPPEEILGKFTLDE